jgi:hypothetical protein
MRKELQDQSRHMMKTVESTRQQVFGITSKGPSCSFPISISIPESIRAMENQLARTRHQRPCTRCSTLLKEEHLVRHVRSHTRALA